MKISTFSSALSIFADVEPTYLYSHIVWLFSLIAETGPCTLRSLEERTGLSNASVSRSVHALGEMHRRGSPGLGLVCIDRDPSEGRRFLVALSPAGKELIARLEQL